MLLQKILQLVPGTCVLTVNLSGHENRAGGQRRTDGDGGVRTRQAHLPTSFPNRQFSFEVVVHGFAEQVGYNETGTIFCDPDLLYPYVLILEDSQTCM
jgi:hypothetical protein